MLNPMKSLNSSQRSVCNIRMKNDFIFTGVKQIQQWTKESFLEKPFSTAKGQIWTKTPSSVPLKQIFTGLQWLKKERDGQIVKSEELSDITQLLNEQQPKQQELKGKGFARMGVKGKSAKKPLIQFYRNRIKAS